MKKMFFISLLLLLAFTAFAQTEADFETDGKGTITKYTGSARDVVIPASIGGKPVTAIFSPKHGFRGEEGAGVRVSGSVDSKTGVPILSLYDGAEQGKPGTESMRKFDIMVVDIQDVGVRFFTYYITTTKIMEACAEQRK
jgi:uncharacterized protein YbbC (DUF1343 family)